MRRALTEGPAFDLTRHFFREFFYLRFLTDAGADSVRRTIMSVVAGSLSIFILFPQTVITKYMILSARSAPHQYRQALLADQLFMICVSMFIVGFVAALVCQSLFPDETDYRVLMTLPVTRRLVLGTKVLALVLFAATFIVSTTVVFGLAFSAAAGGRWAEQPLLTRMLAHASATGLASIFAGAGVMSIQGLIAVLSPRSWLRSVSVATQTAMICALILVLPVIARVSGQAAFLQTRPRVLYFAPPAWFLGLEQVMLGSREPYFLRMGGLALLGFAASVLMIGGCYAAVYRRFDQLVLRSSRPPWRSQRRSGWLRRSTRNAAEHPTAPAIVRFTTATLRRSGLHQIVFCAISAGGVTLTVNRLLGAQHDWWLNDGAAPSSQLVGSLLAMPLVLMIIGVAAVRSALLLPLDVRANWVFRLTEDAATRPYQLIAVERALVRLGMAPHLVVTFLIQALVLGLSNALLALIPTALLGLLLIEMVLRDWRRIPFTCTYIPGKRHLIHTLLLTFTIFTVFVNVGSGLINASLRLPERYVMLLGALLAAFVWMRRTRLASWGRAPLEFEDSLPDDIQVIPLRGVS